MTPPFILAEIAYWASSIKLPMVVIHKYPVRIILAPSFTSNQDKTANNYKIICAAVQQLGPHPIKYAAASSSSIQIICSVEYQHFICRMIRADRYMMPSFFISFDIFLLIHPENDSKQPG